jgi:3-oxoadipate enol-lactonase
MSIIQFVTIGKITLHYSVEGVPDGLPLVFINSLGTDFRIWDNVIPHFADRFRLIRHDKRGHGLSDCPPGPYSIRDHSDDLAGLLDYLQVNEAVVIGISVGGLIALDYAINHPQQVKALVLSDTGAKLGTADYWNERIEAVRANGLAHLAEPILTRWFAPIFLEQRPTEYQGYANMLTRTPAAGYNGTCAALGAADLREPARTITAKTLVLCGAEDQATPPEIGRELAQTLPNARFELIDQAGHLPCIEQPEAMAAKIDQFLRELVS